VAANEFIRRTAPFRPNDDDHVTLARQAECSNRLRPISITDEGQISAAYQGIDLGGVRE
jgi:hypothetical protein